MREIKKPDRRCRTCGHAEYEHDAKMFSCMNEDGEYFGQFVRDDEHCPDWEGKDGTD